MMAFGGGEIWGALHSFYPTSAENHSCALLQVCACECDKSQPAWQTLMPGTFSRFTLMVVSR